MDPYALESSLTDRVITPDPMVFVVDDDETVRRTIRLWVESAGFRASAYGSVDEFLDTYDPCRPGCLIFDVRTPGLTGAALQEKLAAKGVEIPVILVAGQEDLARTEGVTGAWDVEVIVKPCTEVLLLNCIRHASGRDAARRRSSTPRSP